MSALSPDALAARRYLYALFQSVFGGEPSAEAIALWRAPVTREAAAVAGVDADAMLTALEELDAETLQRAYLRHFVGPGKIPVLPWESAIVGNERVLFQRPTLEVRRSYRAAGFAPVEGHHVADDHLSLELGFMALLAGRAFEGAEQKDEEAQEAALAESEKFLDEHLRCWLGDYAAALAQEADAGFYAHAARAAADFIEADYRWLAGR
ncbi:molecular chaperone TorD family protein [Adlercreutzia sp. R7]|uniref:Molecular chaperone TorD family protein n=1 Tax=Adlercreutzia wanghongyangiae TaxID=3111451 RepID=A0ABU6IKL1_9ACTN|nr:molecular chaperone TorD family protein [Adlercreutzia sp. R7]